MVDHGIRLERLASCHIVSLVQSFLIDLVSIWSSYNVKLFCILSPVPFLNGIPWVSVFALYHFTYIRLLCRINQMINKYIHLVSLLSCNITEHFYSTHQAPPESNAYTVI